MSKIAVKKSQIHAWHDAIVEAERTRHILLPEDAEHYLVSLLVRYTQKPEFVSNIVGHIYLEAIEKSTIEKNASLRDVGDQCLLFAGLFPEHATKRLVSSQYYSCLGKTAYDQLAIDDKGRINPLYRQLALYFGCMLNVLRALRPLSHAQTLEMVNTRLIRTNINHNNRPQ